MAGLTLMLDELGTLNHVTMVTNAKYRLGNLKGDGETYSNSIYR